MAGGLDVPSILQSLSGVSLVGLLALASRIYFLWRKQNLSEFQVEREGYGNLIETFREELKTIRGHNVQCEQQLTELTRKSDMQQLQIVAIQLRNGYGTPGEELPPGIRAIFDNAVEALAALGGK